MSEQIGEEKSFSKVWVVLATILLLFIIAYFLDQIIATAVPTYTGFFDSVFAPINNPPNLPPAP